MDDPTLTLVTPNKGDNTCNFILGRVVRFVFFVFVFLDEKLEPLKRKKLKKVCLFFLEGKRRNGEYEIAYLWFTKEDQSVIGVGIALPGIKK